MTLARRRINLKFELGTGDFGESGADTVSYEGLRISASVVKAGGLSMSELNMKVYGLSLSVMNKLTILGNPVTSVRRNTVTLSAGDDESGMAVAFVGTILEAWVDASSAPQVALIVVAKTGMLSQYKPVPPVSYKGTVSADTVMSGLAAQMFPPLPLENTGVDVMITNPYLSGTTVDQIKSVAAAGDFNYLIDDTVLAIWPRGTARKAEIPLVSASTGMVNYPVRTDTGIQVTMLYNRAVIFGANIKVESDLTPAAGLWPVISVSHDLESETPGGKWFTRVECSLFGQPLAISQS